MIDRFIDRQCENTKTGKNRTYFALTIFVNYQVFSHKENHLDHDSNVLFIAPPFL